MEEFQKQVLQLIDEEIQKRTEKNINKKLNSILKNLIAFMSIDDIVEATNLSKTGNKEALHEKYDPTETFLTSNKSKSIMKTEENEKVITERTTESISAWKTIIKNLNGEIDKDVERFALKMCACGYNSTIISETLGLEEIKVREIKDRWLRRGGDTFEVLLQEKYKKIVRNLSEWGLCKEEILEIINSNEDDTKHLWEL